MSCVCVCDSGGSSNVPNLIIDKDHDSDEEDDGFISKEDDHDQPPPDLHEMTPKVDEEEGEHGMFIMSMLLNTFFYHPGMLDSLSFCQSSRTKHCYCVDMSVCY